VSNDPGPDLRTSCATSAAALLTGCATRSRRLDSESLDTARDLNSPGCVNQLDTLDRERSSQLYPVVAMSLGTIPGCVAVGLVDGNDRRILASWSKARIDLELAVAVCEDLIGAAIAEAAEILLPGAAAPRQMVMVVGNNVHLFDRLDGGLCFVAVCRNTANLTSMLAAFRISRGLMNGAVA
jgi:hypothetical protein